MSKITAAEELFQEANICFKNIDKIYNGAVQYKIYIEDKGKATFYEIIFDKLYGPENLDYEIFDDQDGKKGLIKKYCSNPEEYKNMTKQKTYFILDKDFDDKFSKREISTYKGYCFESIQAIENFIILKKYCIENYFINISKLCLAVKMWCPLTSQELLKHEKNTIKLLAHIKRLSKYFLLNKYLDLTVSKDVGQLIDWENNEIKEVKIIELNKKLKDEFSKIDYIKKEKIKNEYSLVEGMEYEQAKEIIFKLFEENSDVDGKEFLKAFQIMSTKCLSQFTCSKKSEAFRNMIALCFTKDELVELKTDLFPIQ